MCPFAGSMLLVSSSSSSSLLQSIMSSSGREMIDIKGSSSCESRVYRQRRLYSIGCARFPGNYYNELQQQLLWGHRKLVYIWGRELRSFEAIRQQSSCCRCRRGTNRLAGECKFVYRPLPDKRTHSHTHRVRASLDG